MRVGAMVVGILLSIWTFFEALLVGGLSNAANDDTTNTAAGGGLLAAIVAGIASALVLALPLVSTILFVFAGLISYAAAASGYPNHWIYGSVFLGLSVMAFFGWLGKRRERRTFKTEKARQEERDARMERLLEQQVQRSGDQIPCPSCGRANPVTVRFCGNCGAAIVANAG